MCINHIWPLFKLARVVRFYAYDYDEDKYIFLFASQYLAYFSVSLYFTLTTYMAFFLAC